MRGVGSQRAQGDDRDQQAHHQEARRARAEVRQRPPHREWVDDRQHDVEHGESDLEHRRRISLGQPRPPAMVIACPVT